VLACLPGPDKLRKPPVLPAGTILTPNVAAILNQSGAQQGWSIAPHTRQDIGSYSNSLVTGSASHHQGRAPGRRSPRIRPGRSRRTCRQRAPPRRSHRATKRSLGAERALDGFVTCVLIRSAVPGHC
jgi:hypothetical protein